MKPTTSEFTVELSPRARVDVINITDQIEDQYGDVLQQYPKTLYCSHHTTAGFLEQSLSERLNHDPEAIEAYLQPFRTLFPPGADYQHDELHLRTELSDEQRKTEPRNADSHLQFIGSGLENCVAYENKQQQPVYFIDLDGVNGQKRRHRTSTVVGFNEHFVVDEVKIPIPVSNHPIDSINLKDDRLGVFAQLSEYIKRYDINHGWIEISLSPHENHAGLTVNEYETLLMKHDLVEILENPLQFMAEKGKNMLMDPRAIPSKAKNYAKYDLVHFVNEFVDALGLSESVIERILDKFLAWPAARFLRMRRSVRLLISNSGGNGPTPIVHGRYQSPILVQWKKADGQTRYLNVRLVRFE